MKATEPDFRALCAELVGWGERTADHYYKLPDILIRVRNALEQTEPEPPTDEAGE